MVPERSTGGTGGARCTTVRASGPYLRYGYRRFAPYHVLVHSAHPYRVGPGLHLMLLALRTLTAGCVHRRHGRHHAALVAAGGGGFCVGIA